MDIGFIFRKSGADQSIPVCLFEYTAMNIPSLCNGTGIMPEFVANQRIGSFVHDQHHLKETISRIIRNP